VQLLGSSHVFHRCHTGKQTNALKCPPNAKLGYFIGRIFCNILAAKTDLPVAGWDVAGNQVKQSGFSRSVGTNDA
jgi:hypothetical protein